MYRHFDTERNTWGAWQADAYLLTAPDGTQVCRSCDYATDSCHCE